MKSLHIEYVVDEEKRPRAILLPIAEWEQVLEDLDELDAIKAYDEAKGGSQESVALEDAVREIEGDYSG